MLLAAAAVNLVETKIGTQMKKVLKMSDGKNGFEKTKHNFPYKWTLKDAVFTKDKGKVFSCFACGGGSTMGYKLAGFDVIGCNEIDPKMMEAYKVNHNPKYSYLEPIQTFKLREDLPQELYELDILDGSPPCSSFSMAGNREKDWGKDKVFREGPVFPAVFIQFSMYETNRKKKLWLNSTPAQLKVRRRGLLYWRRSRTHFDKKSKR